MPDAPALALLEFSSIAVGARASDAVVKKAPVELLRAGSFQPGRYAILFAGDVASVEESLGAGRLAGGNSVVDVAFLPDVHSQVRAAATGGTLAWSGDTLGVLETATIAAVLQAADAAVKGANVSLVQMRLGDGLGGKGLAWFCGEQADVEAAIDIARGVLSTRPAPPCTSIIPRIDDVLRRQLERTTRLGDGW